MAGRNIFENNDDQSDESLETRLDDVTDRQITMPELLFEINRVEEYLERLRAIHLDMVRRGQS